MGQFSLGRSLGDNGGRNDLVAAARLVLRRARQILGLALAGPTLLIIVMVTKMAIPPYANGGSLRCPV